MPDILFFDEISDAEAHLVGGKGLSLGKTARAGLPVPAGFVVTTQAYRRLADRGIRADAGFVRAVAGAYETLGNGLVAVRSSATAEDAADTSFAGQQETILGVKGDEPLLDAIERCWRSLFTERAVAYRAKQNVDGAGLAMAVVVQKLVPAEAAGVLFTRDPLDPDGKRMLAEASWGLGEVVVSGRVQPDRFTLDRDTGSVLTRVLGSKAIRVTAGVEEHVPAELQRQFCLSDAALSQLVDLGRKVEAFYGDPRDIEWAFAGGTFHLLQARPITVAGAAEREQVRQGVISSLKATADPRGTVWVRYNLSEVLPEPAPMTWAVVQRLLAADGGFGAMNRDLGAKPDPALGSLSGFDLVAGRPMANLSRLPRMQFARPPIEYPLGTYKREPHKALDPKPVLNPLAGQGCVFGVLTLPGTILSLTRLIGTTKKQSAVFAQKFETEIAPAFATAARQARAQNWSQMDPPALVREFETWTNKTLVEFARDSLKPTVFAELAWTEVFDQLKPKLGEERARTAVGELSLGAAPPGEVNLPGGIRDLANERISRATFLERFGHRSTNEMEFAQPRWSEVPQELDKLMHRAGWGAHTAATADVDKIATEAKISGPFRDQLAAKVKLLRTYLGLREAGKHYLLMGFAVIRRALVELDRRFELNGGIFFLTPADLPDLLAKKDLSAKVTAARKNRQTELSLEVPPVLFSDDLDAIGRPLPEPAGRDKLTGVALSAGVAEGPALVLTEPTAAPPEGGYVLVCPSTDPAWVPLFVHAKALVMETGGVLSHGAIVAREFGLPAVAGLPNATQQIKTGQTIRVDGGRGTVTIVGEA
ncbi:pyruvate phosphate dikinase pep pyruvate-binding protein : Pyruvate phosphate dikinase PEP/pyruvate-binding protein OS=Rhodopirellula sp. SWK7 GN=RRSWK_04808 PE=4 SV=1: PPDK_N: PEP-utilizers [Gemmata massiliana]|uniref:Pyruvate phosphate dikinase AMP/ATP-binding domain-containing protein n=1 Tax=Gemmata massiliana TaxID=1210884 RepID=A0A6P2DKX6_9BACT|nr:PEP/pyruvate-binding domain-containing protein [Gemmata massiliana]VTS03692.1 pyruvate phosphate dikinase pep pyruvate-binding protein : Pyruvate phosphate dikinase PEP/pyruvate-binding protein OS=Rhodopirellula sp. SWK7 GN=RRSWK_04808 PE=4 SV=1: PPDK_N: PEP-utilizers [Gemmata massiliana]